MAKTLYSLDPLEPDVYRSVDVAVCPTCKKTIACPWALFLRGEDDTVVVECPSCGELFSVSKEIQISYVSRP